jgi:general secretion pathway protein K
MTRSEKAISRGCTRMNTDEDQKPRRFGSAVLESMQIPHSEPRRLRSGALGSFLFLAVKSIRNFFSGAPAPLLSRLRMGIERSSIATGCFQNDAEEDQKPQRFGSAFITVHPRLRVVSRRRGSALLAVLWLSAALSAIAFSVAAGVRSETERVGNSEEDVRAYYLATAAINRAILHLQWSAGGSSENPFFIPGQPQMALDFPSGFTMVDVIPETGKMNINTATPQSLMNLLSALGTNPDQAFEIASAIDDWRKPAINTQPSDFDQYYLAQIPSFQAPHASFLDVEELLSVAGVTPDLFYGSWVRVGDADHSHLAPRTGLRDCVSVYGSNGAYDATWVEPAVLAASGVSGDSIQNLINRRAAGPILQADLPAVTGDDPDFAGKLQVATHTIYTLRATARLRRPDGSLSDLRRTVSALVKIYGANARPSYTILRWYDRD